MSIASTFAHLPYRPGVGMMVLNAENKAFVAKRIDTRAEAWQMPQGGVDAGEDISTAALRELQEEIGTDKVSLLHRFPGVYRYDLPDALIPTIWHGRYRGQEQHWFCYRFLGSDADINIETEHPEFSEWKWAEIHTLPDLIVPFKRELYAALVADISALL